MRQPLGEFDGARMRVGPDGEERQLLRLTGGSLGEFATAMAGLDDKEAGKPVEVAMALVVPDVGALAADHDRHVPLAGLVDGVPREVHPQVALCRGRPAVLAGLGHELRSDGHRVPQV